MYSRTDIKLLPSSTSRRGIWNTYTSVAECKSRIRASNPFQVGPLYFLVPRKCSVFGINNETIPRQLNFMTDEIGECGKGANAVSVDFTTSLDISALEKEWSTSTPTTAPGRTRITMIQHLLWRTLIGLISEVTISLL